MNVVKRIFTAASILCVAGHALADSFHFSYADVFSPGSETYVVGQSNVQRFTGGFSGFETFYSPTLSLTPAYLTYHFGLGKEILSASLRAQLSVFSASPGSSDYGVASLWGSRDGASWELLLNAPRTVGVQDNWTYNQSLPPSLLGGNDIWIQVQMQTTGDNTFSRFSQGDTRFPIPERFAFNATTVPEPSAAVLALVGIIGFALVSVRKRRKS